MARTRPSATNTKPPRERSHSKRTELEQEVLIREPLSIVPASLSCPQTGMAFAWACGPSSIGGTLNTDFASIITNPGRGGGWEAVLRSPSTLASLPTKCPRSQVSNSLLIHCASYTGYKTDQFRSTRGKYQIVIVQGPRGNALGCSRRRSEPYNRKASSSFDFNADFPRKSVQNPIFYVFQGQPKKLPKE